MARTWSEIQTDLDAAEAAVKAAKAKKAEVEEEAALKSLPWALGLAALGGLVAWGFGKATRAAAERERREKEEEYERVMAERAAERSARRAKEEEEWRAAARARSEALLAKLDADLAARIKRDCKVGNAA